MVFGWIQTWQLVYLNFTNPRIYNEHMTLVDLASPLRHYWHQSTLYCRSAEVDIIIGQVGNIYSSRKLLGLEGLHKVPYLGTKVSSLTDSSLRNLATWIAPSLTLRPPEANGARQGLPSSQWIYVWSMYITCKKL